MKTKETTRTELKPVCQKKELEKLKITIERKET